MASFEVFPVTVYGEPYGWYWQLLSPDGTRTVRSAASRKRARMRKPTAL